MPSEPEMAKVGSPANPMIFWLIFVSVFANTLSLLRTAISALSPIFAVLVDLATRTPSDVPIPAPPKPTLTLPAV